MHAVRERHVFVIVDSAKCGLCMVFVLVSAKCILCNAFVDSAKCRLCILFVIVGSTK